MKIKSIKIELELDEHNDGKHASEIEFKDYMWTANGPMYSRVTETLHKVYKILKEGI